VDERILSLLREDFAHARADLNQASEHFDAVIRENPADAPAETAARAHQASTELSAARKAMMDAATRLNRYLVSGTVPSDLA
jgi:hypothetical protein